VLRRSGLTPSGEACSGLSHQSYRYRVPLGTPSDCRHRSGASSTPPTREMCARRPSTNSSQPRSSSGHWSASWGSVTCATPAAWSSESPGGGAGSAGAPRASSRRPHSRGRAAFPEDAASTPTCCKTYPPAATGPIWRSSGGWLPARRRGCPASRGGDGIPRSPTGSMATARTWRPGI